jgi:hypothetical protein
MEKPRPWAYPSATDPGVVPSPWDRPDPLSRQWHLVGDTIGAGNWSSPGQTHFQVPPGRVGVLHFVAVTCIITTQEALTDPLHPLAGLDGRLLIRSGGRSVFDQRVDEAFLVHMFTPFSISGGGLVQAYIEARSPGPVCIADGQTVDWELTTCAWWDAGAKGAQTALIETFEPIPLHRWIESQALIEARRAHLARKVATEYGMTR